MNCFGRIGMRIWVIFEIQTRVAGDLSGVELLAGREDVRIDSDAGDAASWN